VVEFCYCPQCNVLAVFDKIVILLDYHRGCKNGLFFFKLEGLPLFSPIFSFHN
jgi:hypothetical protein